ncbi:MAG: tRNA uracil 4-sulfurtransferase ThiI [Coriobacteriia bacterium]|nr:tRNA uracil 4-sulfurtransferase ThiI [Coriobacteriia bacterium]
MFERAALVHYHEIGLKGRNRSTFEDRLRANLDFAVRGLTDAKVERIASRLIVPVTGRATAETLLAACAALPGVAHVSDCLLTARDLGQLKAAAAMVMREEIDRLGCAGELTFAVDSRRSATDFDVPSTVMNVEIGQHLVDEFGLRVDLGAPDVTVWVEVVQGTGYVSARRLFGPGGLPVGSSGKVVCLLSAGIDSPVAASRMMRRGAVVVGVHFSGAPQTSDASTTDTFDIADALAPAGGLGRVYSVPFGDLQRQIMLACPPDLRILLYRRLMVRVAEAVARAENAKALVTGESLGQVASQTLDNIAAVDAAATLPVLRPLIGTDKQEIIAEARRIGTYEISVRQHPDCCTLFMPRTPETHARPSALAKAEEALDVPAMVAEAIASIRYRDFPCASYRPTKRAPGVPCEG